MSAPASTVAPDKARPNKKPINRKLAAMAFVGLGVLLVFALIGVTLHDPRKATLDKADKDHAREIAALPTGTTQSGERIVASIAKEAADAAKRQPVAVDPLAALTQPKDAVSLPPLDSRLLALDQAQREVMATSSPPSAGTVSRTSEPRDRDNAFAQATPPNLASAQRRQGAGFGAYEAYDAPAQADAASEEATKRAAAAGAVGFYDTAKPQAPPSPRVIVQGAMIPAVLVSRIDTRTAGPLLARVTRTVYDSPTARIALIPQGSRLVGRYDTNVSMGVDRITATFDRLVLPDGRAVPLPGFVGGGLDGTAGINGRFHSNIVRAIGPSFVVALVGQYLDKQIHPQSTSIGNQTQAPTVAQQVIPQINQAVLDRYSAARPYFTAEPGQELRLILTADIEVPAVAAAVRQ